ncbi:MAG: PdxA family dehydrogenase [Panacagrimonas sp.]
MTNKTLRRPIIGIVPGDPNGIGPEILVKAWASKSLHPHCRPLVIGDSSVIEQAIRLTGLDLATRSISGVENLPADYGDNDKLIDVFESVEFPAEATRYGHDIEQAGAVSGAWLDHADRLARQGVLDGTVMGPISAKAMDMAGVLSSVASHKPGEETYLLLRSGALVIAHLTDHVPLRDVSAAITQSAVHRLIARLAHAMSDWGLGGGRIGVAGFNPHASGQEEKLAISPAVTQAQAQGINVEGPVSPDSIFRHCIEGRYDAVIAMYHDQGHIAIKTWGFAGNNVVFLGPPYVHTTVAHGVAYDLAGTGRADHSMIQNAILNAAYLAGGRGFHAE